MRKKLSVGLVVAVALSLLIAILGPVSASGAKAPPAQVATVQTFLDSLNPLNIDNAKATWVADQQGMMADKLGQVLDGTTITITKPSLKLKGDVVTAKYKIKVTKGSFYRENKKGLDTFTVGSDNLISASTFNFDYLVLGVKIGYPAPSGSAYATSNMLVDDVIAGLQQYLKTDAALSGIPVMFVPYDTYDAGANKATPAKAVDAYNQAAADKCTGFFGGIGADDMFALNVASGTGKTTLLYSGPQGSPEKMGKYTVRGGNNPNLLRTKMADFIAQLNPAPAKIAIMAADDPTVKAGMVTFKTILAKETKKLKPKPTIVYERYVPLDAENTAEGFKPYLNEVKASGADVLCTQVVGTFTYKTIYKNIEDLGGWGDIRFLCMEGLAWFSAIDSKTYQSMVGAVDTYSTTTFVMGSAPDIEAAFDAARDAKQLTMASPAPFPSVIPPYLYYWAGAMNIIKAVELAKTDDPILVNKAAHSGKLEWPGPWETFKVDKKGESNSWGRIYQFITPGPDHIPYKQITIQ
jgi:hypothetical protein